MKAGDVELFVLHDIAQLKFDPKKAGYRAVIYGHSHRASMRGARRRVVSESRRGGPAPVQPVPLARKIEVRGQELDVSLITL